MRVKRYRIVLTVANYCRRLWLRNNCVQNSVKTIEIYQQNSLKGEPAYNKQGFDYFHNQEYKQISYILAIFHELLWKSINLKVQIL